MSQSWVGAAVASHDPLSLDDGGRHLGNHIDGPVAVHLFGVDVLQEQTNSCEMAISSVLDIQRMNSEGYCFSYIDLHNMNKLKF